MNKEALNGWLQLNASGLLEIEGDKVAVKIVKFFGAKGETAEFSKPDLLFFSQPVSPRKAIYSIPILLRLARNLSLRGLALFFKLSIDSLAGHPMSAHSRSEYRQMVDDFIGFRPVKAIGLHNLSMSFARQDETASEFLANFMTLVVINQYCLSSANTKGKVMVDAGANVGFFSIFAARLGAKKIYAFEPVKMTYLLMRKNIRENGVSGIVVPINMALGDCPGSATIHYNFPGDGMASLLDLGLDMKKQRVKVTSIDSFAKGKGRIDFIKMDAEGYEGKILSGARETIRKFKPILSFSAYHRPEDKKELPELVKKLNPGYNCVLMNKAEEDFYCK